MKLSSLITLSAVALFAISSECLAQEPIVVEPHTQRTTTSSEPAQPAAARQPEQHYYHHYYSSYDDRANHWAVGVNFNTGTNDPVVAFGIGANLQFFATDDFRIEAAYNGYLRRKNWAAWDINLNLHYLIEVAERLEIYPLLGGTFSHAQFKADKPYPAGTDGSQKEGAFGLNIGAGIQYSFNDHLFAKAEGYWKYTTTKELDTKYTDHGYSGELGPRVVAVVGVGYRF